MDPVGREAFVNHMHFTASDEAAAAGVIESWATELGARWPDRQFRIYRHVEDGEVIVRFHMVRQGVPNWCDVGVEVTVVSGVSRSRLLPRRADA